MPDSVQSLDASSRNAALACFADQSATPSACATSIARFSPANPSTSANDSGNDALAPVVVTMRKPGISVTIPVEFPQ
ncbi:hypothetical protein [Pandoraea faecigallinarum]|uniref:Uncharacterized protein n=1 Tax=Pandoraea faecigallinarum TaxID=656179 RepID=A0A0H3WXB7_9BURK|nr:hypothetical protein [Pandoraea faecigallinarum]